MLLTKPPLIVRRAKPQTSRAEFLRAFQAFLQGHSERFHGLRGRVQDGERDVVTMMKSADVPLLRKVRRLIITGGTQHSIDLYSDFSRILLTLISKPATKPYMNN